MNYKTLRSKLLDRRVTFCKTTAKEIPEVTYDSPADHVMTDLKEKLAITIDPKASLHEVRLQMLDKNIHLLFVVDNNNFIDGIITSDDLSDEKSIQLGVKLGITYREIRAADIMTAVKNLEVLEIEDITKAKVGNIVATLKSAKRVHALVIEKGTENAEQLMIRGIFSLNQIGHQINMELQTGYYASVGNILKSHQREFYL
jgi:predicted transcriptional regulator